jgi:hypothetical protein
MFGGRLPIHLTFLEETTWKLSPVNLPMLLGRHAFDKVNLGEAVNMEAAGRDNIRRQQAPSRQERLRGR